LSVVLAAALLLAVPAAGAELEPARDALRRHDYARAASLLKPLADGGNVEAAYQLGVLYLPRSNDTGLPPQAAEACRLLTTAATQAHARAAYTLASQVAAGNCGDSGRSADEWRAVAIAAGLTATGGAAASQAIDSADPVTLLKRAARTGDLQTLEHLLGSVPASAVGADHRTALHEAADGQQVEAARRLLAHGAPVDARDSAGDTPLILAARRGAGPVIEVLLAAKADPNATDRRGGTALMLAVAAAGPAAVELLLQHGASLQAKNAQGLTSLDLAVRAEGTAAGKEIAAVLRARGATGSARIVVAHEPRGDDRFAGWTPVMVAAEKGDPAALRNGLAAGFDVNAADPHGTTALMAAARAGHVPAIETLLAGGARIEARDAAGDTALGGALRRHQLGTLQSLLRHGADPNALQAGGAPPLGLAAEFDAPELAGALLGAGARPGTTDAAGRTALMTAAQHDAAELVATLINRGSDTRARDQTGRTALALAVQAGAARAVGALLGAGGLDLADNDGLTPLAIAAQRGDVDLTRRLLKANAPREARTRTGNTPLLLAAAAGREAVVRELVSAGANLEARNDLGNTPLLAAVASRQAATSRTLLTLGADPRIRNGAALNAPDLARQVGDPAVAAVFGAR